jgi:hypothetical protein
MIYLCDPKSYILFTLTIRCSAHANRQHDLIHFLQQEIVTFWNFILSFILMNYQTERNVAVWVSHTNTSSTKATVRYNPVELLAQNIADGPCVSESSRQNVRPIFLNTRILAPPLVLTVTGKCLYVTAV